MTLTEALSLVLTEHHLSVVKHGTWGNYTTEQMMAKIIHELIIEAGEAEKLGDITGEHGMIRKLSQVASCCLKAMMVLSNRTTQEG